MTPEHLGLCWRAEEACRLAWPSPYEVTVDGWLLRGSGGPTKRTNSVNPLQGSDFDSAKIVAWAESYYRALGQRVIFRVPSIAVGMDAPLEALGFAREPETLTLFAELPVVFDHRDVELTSESSAEWLAVQARIAGWDAEAQRIYQTMLATISHPRKFAASRVDGVIVSLAYGVVVDGLLVLGSIATDPSYRQRGFAMKTISTLMNWAASKNAQGSTLQVFAENTAANQLYQRLGFDRELYRYHYRIKEA